MIQETNKLIKYGFLTRRSWWFTATARTRARFARTSLGSLWLGIANLLCSLLLGGVYGAVFKVSNLNTALKFLKTKNFWVSAFDVSAKKDFTKNNWKGNKSDIMENHGRICTARNFSH